MADLDSKKPDTTGKSKEATDDEGQPLANTDFMREKIKSRPINSKKLLRRTIITIVMAIIFGIVACCTFLLLQPLLSNQLGSSDKAQTAVSFPKETVSDEIQREDLIASEEEKAAADAASAQASVNESVTEAAEKEIAAALSSLSLTSADYATIYESLKEVADSAEISVVTVTAATQGTDFINDSFVKEASTSGLIVAITDTETLILANSSSLSDAQSIMVTFYDEQSVTAQIKASDYITGLGIISVSNTDIPSETTDVIEAATLGTSLSSNLLGTPVIAVGSPTGTPNSLSYGMITSTGRVLDLTDSKYTLMTTDIYASPLASGFIINLSGQVIGVIDMSYNEEGLENLVSAIGISDVKTLIQNLSNGIVPPYLGIHASDIPSYLTEDGSLPTGVYISKIETGSPAMDSGLQSGDIITEIDGEEVTSYSQLLSLLYARASGDTISITVMRQTPDDYTELTLSATLESSPSE
ncbi:MAG: S1C family serine protease [Butyrivibrio sp.]|uniref:S1C family serine protease n=1 Tax=Butyrivibrio sp. TaxID=28121 RepID=UPI0025E3FEA4|nr:S1C family serine protease [Butyrivibrio sp.]MCR5772319.1 S1C family serine protease [Butyrivibrio sp.]